MLSFATVLPKSTTSADSSSSNFSGGSGTGKNIEMATNGSGDTVNPVSSGISADGKQQAVLH